MSNTRAISRLALISCGALTAACAAPRTAVETRAERCARVTPPLIVPAEKLSGEPAVRTPEAAAAGVKGPVALRCSISTRGVAELCEVLDRIPASQEQVIRVVLEKWRFRPATSDGRVAALEASFTVPLVDPPPGWEMPKPREDRVFSFGDPAAPKLTPPKLVGGTTQVAYPAAAIDACIEGRAIARCTITEGGELTDCHMIKSLAHVDEVVLANLATRRYTPVVHEGKAIRVTYVLPFTFRLP